MKKTIIAALMLLSFQAFAQTPMAGILNRFTDSEKGRTVFVEKGNHAIGFSGNYYNFNAAGYTDGDGFSLLSLLNMGDGVVHSWNITPRLSWFVADDVSIGANLLYSGYVADTDINLDFREILPSLYAWLDDSSIANVAISSRHMVHHNWGLAFSARKYMSFFGSKTFGVFGEARLFAKYGNTFSCPRTEKQFGKTRTSETAQVGIDIAGGLAVKLRDNSALTISVPIIGLTWNGAWQSSERRYEAIKKDETGKNMKDDVTGEFIKEEVVVPGGGKMSYLRVSRATNVLDLIGIQIGYTHFIGPKPKNK